MQEGSRASTLGHTVCQRSGRITKLHPRHPIPTSPIPLAALSLFPGWGCAGCLLCQQRQRWGLALLTDPTGGEAIFVLLLTCSEDTAEEQPMENNFVL